ncbi:LysR family transcriptional regulator [Actinocorallia aurea]
MDPERLLDGRLKLRHLTLVTTIAREGTLLRTAQVLHVTQPVVTRSLREAEAAVGVELFTRGPRGVRPTPAGEILIAHAHRVLGNIRAAGVRISELQRVGLEPVRVGTNLAGAYALIPNALVELKREHPNVSVTVIEAGSDELTALLRRSDVDLLVGRLQPRTDTTAEPLRRLRLYDEPVRLVVRQGHPAADAQERDLEDLLAYPWILPNAPSLLRSEIDDLFRLQDLPLPTDITECSTILTVQAILRATDAIAPLPVLIGSNTPGLMVLDTELDTVPRSIGITTLAGPEQPTSVQRFIRELVTAARSLEKEIAVASRPRRPRRETH